MPPLHEKNLVPRLFNEEEVEGEASKGGDADATMDLERFQGLVDSNDEIWEVEPVAPLVQKQRHMGDASGNGYSPVSAKSMVMESAPKRSLAGIASTMA